MQLNLEDLMNKPQLLGYLGQMIRQAQATALNEDDPDQCCKIYAQAHAFQMLFDAVAGGGFDIITPDTRIH